MWRAVDEFTTDSKALRQRFDADVSPIVYSAKLKLVDGCNLRCFMCHYWKQQRRGELTTEEVKDVLTGLSELRCQKVHFSGGEIFLRKDAIELFAWATTLGMRCNVTTNGTLLNKEKIKEMLRVPVRSVTLSIDGPDPKVHDDIRGQSKAYKKTLKTLNSLLRYRSSKTKIRINTVVNKRNYNRLPELAMLLRELNVDSWLLLPMDAWVDKQDMLSAEDIVIYNNGIAPLLEEIVHIPDLDPYIYGRSVGDIEQSAEQQYACGYYRTQTCFVPWFHVLVGPKGGVYPCCGTHQRIKPLGNVREQTIQAIFNGETYQQFRREMRENRLQQCHHCDDFLKENIALQSILNEER